MALVDNPKAYILRMFEMESREGRGAHVQMFLDGAAPSDMPIECGELVYGICKGRFAFTPTSFLMSDEGRWRRVPWASISYCSSEHGGGAKTSELRLADGETLLVPVGEMATGWSGRVSQLFHGMIVRWGRSAATGPELMELETFLGKARSAYCVAPNVEPHFPLEEFARVSRALSQRQDVRRVLLRVVDFEQDQPVSDCLVIVSSSGAEAFTQIATTLGASGIAPARPMTLRQINIEPGFEQAWEILWD
ncbi:MAG: hypothetical protein ABW110_13630 [Steroidobacteraceae bacterium]